MEGTCLPSQMCSKALLAIGELRGIEAQKYLFETRKFGSTTRPSVHTSPNQIESTIENFIKE